MANPVTMQQIDRLREELQGWKILSTWEPALLRAHGMEPGCIKNNIEIVESTINHVLVQWWSQGCTVVERPTEEQWREMLASTRADTFRAEARAERAEAELQRIMDFCKEACNGSRSHDNWVFEVVALLRVARGQRDDAEARALAAEAKLSKLKWADAQREIIHDLRCMLRLPPGVKLTDAVAKKLQDIKEARNALLDCTPSQGARISKALAILTEGAETVQRAICACGRHTLLPSVGYVTDELGHHKAKRCTLTFEKP